MTLGVYPLRPASRGSVHVDAADPLGPPVIEPRFLSEDEDRRRLIAGIRIARRIVAAPAFDGYRGEETAPGEHLWDERSLTDHLRGSADTSYHPVGTCRMGAGGGAVVDPRLRLRGLSGLRVIDASVMPTMVSGNTQAATMMIAEKGAAMIREEAGARPSHAARTSALAGEGG
nr:GMC oxidoreductase [Stappia taiwanensis]